MTGAVVKRLVGLGTSATNQYMALPAWFIIDC